MTIKTIVLIDDEPDILTIATLCLERIGGWTVHAAGNGVDGIAAARRTAPDVILLDVMMPGLDGPGTLAQLRADSDLAHIPVVFLTARTQRSDVEAYLRLGVVGVIDKPFDPMKMPEQVRAILGSRS